jgi:PAS domain S-box-containing protein
VHLGKIDEAREESETRYRTLFDQAPVGVCTFDRELRIVDFNPAFVRLTRASHERLAGLDLHTLDPRVRLLLDRVLDGEPGFYEGAFDPITRDANLLISVRLTPLRSASGEVIGGIATVEDITDRREAQAALQRSEARFRALIEGAPDAVGVFRDGGHLYVNPALAAYMGYEKQGDLARVAVIDLIHPDDRAMFVERNRRRASGERLAAKEYRLVRRDGRVVTAEITSITIEYDGAPAVLVILRDLTERKQMQLQLVQSDRMASVGMLAAGIAHEINNPLSYLMANLEMVAKDELAALARLGLPPHAMETLARITEMVGAARDGAERVRRIVRDVKTFSRVDDATRERVDVREVIDASLHLVDNEIRHRARLVREYADVPPVLANEARLGQVFLNLLVNAVQALPPRSSGENEVRVRTFTRAGRVVVEVSDSGEGIAADVLPRVFDPFFTTKAVGVGTGLGLFVCQGIVTSLDGTLGVESRQGEGTTFRVDLPACEVAPILADLRGPARAAFAPLRAPLPRGQLTTRRGRVLVIDDEPCMGRALIAALGEEHDVRFATSGREAFEMLAKDDRVDVVLCDLMMPGMTGMELWGLVTRERPALSGRFVFVTGGAFTPQARAFLEEEGSGAPRHPRLEKPFDVAELRAIVKARMAAAD